MKYRLMVGTHSRFVNSEWRRFMTGELIELSSEDAAQFAPGRLELATDEAAKTPPPPPPLGDAERFAEILAQNVTSVREKIDTISDTSELHLLIAAERTAGDRKGVVEYAYARIIALDEKG